MDSYIRKTLSKMLTLFLAIGMGFSTFSCTDPETTDSTKFKLFYPDVTNIGPSMGAEIPQPTYIGAKPSDFEITEVTFKGAAVEKTSFEIDAKSGRIQIMNTNEMAVGTYKLSIACRTNGKFRVFKDLIAVNMMKAIPEGITVLPEILTVDYKDLIDADSKEELPTAKITTEKDHISISKYMIENVYLNDKRIEKFDFLRVSKDGVVYMERVSEDAVAPGKYTVDFKLATAIVGEESQDGIFERALTINVTSKPLRLVYEPNELRVEKKSKGSSVAPALAGSPEGLVYAIKSVEPANAAITIDAETGVLSIEASDALEVGSEFVVSVSATNEFGSADFDTAFKFSIVSFINPVTKLVYAEIGDIIQSTAFECKVAEVDGDELTYSFVGLDEKLAGLQIDQNTGRIYAEKGNQIAPGTYTVTVSAQNNKSSLEAKVSLVVKANPYFFTAVNWGNNIGLSPLTDHASQFRVKSEEEFTNLTFQVQSSDVAEGTAVEYTLTNQKSKGLKVEIDAATGQVSVQEGWTAGKVLMFVVKATAGKGTAGETVVKTPVFIHCSAAIDDVVIEYTPFVFKVNPRSGGYSVAPVLTGLKETDQFIMEYRRAFDYYNINGPESHIDGQPGAKDKTSFLSILWQQFFESVGIATPNYGARRPMVYTENEANLGSALIYVDRSNDHKVKVNPNKWSSEDGFANGVMIAQMTFDLNGDDKVMPGTKTKQVFPIAVWFNPNF